ncbi:hypothetical protein HD806DRAFT_317365 [Xylariaceae sp. AK1471]|nr:hypothetical protein HD806DRAFT_317365 [Xylariaceae sp. AK1471]
MAITQGGTTTPIAFASSEDLPSYKWAVDAGNISQIPSIQKTTSDLRTLLGWKSRPHIEVYSPVPYIFQFNPLDCNTTSGTRNCTEACRDNTALFTPTNLHVCSMLASASLLVANKTLSLDLSNETTSQVAEEWQVPNLTAFDGAGVIGNISECIYRSCITAPDVGRCNGSVASLAARPITASSMSTLIQTLDHYCQSPNSVLNTDIAGPGVIMSYIFQISLALLFYVLINFSSVWPHRIGKFLGLGRASLREKGDSIQKRLASSRFGAAVLSSLNEFQEVQLYFVGSIQVASFISFNPDNPNTSSANSNSFGSALLSSAIINILGVNGAYTILLCQVGLQRQGMHWWYIFVLMTTVFALAQAIVAKGQSLLPSTEVLFDKLEDDHAIPACGGNPSPMTYCQPPLSFTAALTTGAEGRHIFTIIGSLAYAGLFLDQLSYAFPGWISTISNKCKISSNKSRAVGLLSRAWPWIRHAYWFSISVLLFLATLLYFAILLEVVPQAGIGDSTKWTFGQLIAVLVWAPTIAKYIYFSICKSVPSSTDHSTHEYSTAIVGIKDQDGQDEDTSKDPTISSGERPSHEADGLLGHRLG